MTIARFRKIIRKHYKEHGRHGLPWRKTRDPYKILVSEIMLQQTQVSRVEGYYGKFIKQFPDFRALARAKTKTVLRAWQGLGYNRRALLLKRLAEEVIKNHKGKLPRGRETLEKLPGVGKGTSGALCTFAFNEPEVFIETNIRRVFIHSFFQKKKKVTDAELARYIERSLDSAEPRVWYWALMDYGAALPKTENLVNPNRRSAHYKKQSVFKGSDRELRGKILRVLLSNRKISASSLINSLGGDPSRNRKILHDLAHEGFI